MVTTTDRGRCGFWVDYDNDGYLDLFVKNYGNTNRLYHNNHDGTFTDMAAAAGIADATLGVDYGTVVSFADYDNDGYMDVFFSGDNTSDVLYHNNRDGTFSDVTATAGIKSLNTGHGIAWGDYNNDGYLDLYVVRGHLGGVGMTGATLYRNNGNGTFTDVTATAGLTITDNVWAAAWGDYDNDGNLDIFVTNAGVDASGPGNHNFVYHNNGNGTFTDVANTVGLALQDNTSLHKGAAWGDYDNDGFLDLLLKDGIGGEKDTGSAAWDITDYSAIWATPIIILRWCSRVCSRTVKASAHAFRRPTMGLQFTARTTAVVVASTLPREQSQSISESLRQRLRT